MSYAYDANNRLLTEQKTQGLLTDLTTYAYDADGNLLSKTVLAGNGGAAGSTYAYNTLNQLVSATENQRTAAYRDYETYLPKCKEITEQLGDMIRDILNASRLQTQGNNEPCSNFSLRALLTELCEPYRLIAEAKGVKFKIELSSDAFVYLPEGQLKKAISNILSNAVNYTEAGQSILVVFDKNKLSVSNECSVLPPEQLQHIFEPFYRPDLAHSQATGGNGLGLYIVQTILNKLRLKYQFVPMPNDRGMSFTIQF